MYVEKLRKHLWLESHCWAYHRRKVVINQVPRMRFSGKNHQVKVKYEDELKKKKKKRSLPCAVILRLLEKREGRKILLVTSWLSHTISWQSHTIRPSEPCCPLPAHFKHTHSIICKSAHSLKVGRNHARSRSEEKALFQQVDLLRHSNLA